MKVEITKDFIDLISDENYELYNEELDIITNRITCPLDSDLTKWIERKKVLEDNTSEINSK